MSDVCTFCIDLMFVKLLLTVLTTRSQRRCWERSGSVVECLTRDQRAMGSSPTSVIALSSLSKTHLSWLSTGSTQEDPSLFNWKIVDGT